MNKNYIYYLSNSNKIIKFQIYIKMNNKHDIKSLLENLKISELLFSEVF